MILKVLSNQAILELYDSIFTVKGDYSSQKYCDRGGGGKTRKRRVREVSDDLNGNGRGEAVGDKDRGRSLLWQESPDGIVTCNLNGYFPWHANKFLFQEKYLIF